MTTLSAGYPAVRFSLAGLFALITTFFLFLLMQHLIKTTGNYVSPGESLTFVPIVKLKDDPPPPPIEDEVIRKDIQPPPVAPIVNGGDSGIGIEAGWGPGGDDGLEKGWTFRVPDTDPVSVVKFDPAYPGYALQRAIEGYVILEFAVDRSGATRDIRVIEAEPAGVFDEAAARAVARYKYQPATRDGKAVERAGMQIRLSFMIER
jgi:protein TonB